MSLAILNDLRAQHGKPPLKAWKESKAKLTAAIDKLRGEAPFEVDIPDVNGEDHLPPLPMADTRTLPPDVVAAADAFAQDVVNKVPAKKAVKKLADAFKKRGKAAPAGSDTIPLVAIAAEMGLNPKVARAKMRRIKLSAGVEVSKHVYHIGKKQQVIDALRKDHRKK
ncbi:MAG: hypothetical protein AB7Q00_14645 [Phycisphaerales bacterium]